MTFIKSHEGASKSNLHISIFRENSGKYTLKPYLLQEYLKDWRVVIIRFLQYSINEVEEQISAGRRYISASITDYNNSIFVFPSNIIAKLCGFKTYEWQYASNIQKENVKVKDIFDN